MTRIGPLRTIILLALTTQVTCQFVDFFNAFLQPYQNGKQAVTKRPTNKQTRRYEDNIFYQNTDRTRNLDPFGFYPTTAKPRKTTRKTTTTKTWYENVSTEKAKKVNLVNTNIHFVDNSNNKRVENNSRRTDNVNNNRQNNNNRRTDNHNNNNRRVVNTDNDYNNAFDYLGVSNNNRKTTTTKRPYSSNISSGSFLTYPNSYTTRNPLLNRPGVKPALVDENRPPITNRPVTKRPIYFPNEGPKWPDTTKRPEASKRPIYVSITERPDDNRNNNRPGNDDNNNRPSNNGNNSNNGQVPDVEEPEIEVGPDEDGMSDAEKRRYLQIAEQKCNEYKSLNVKKVVALPLAPSNHGVEVNVSTCAPTNVPLIIGGKVVSINEFPHMGLVGWKKIQKAGYSWKCGASLISERYLLTAGHCTYHDKDYNVVSGPPQAIQLGSSYFDDPSATVVSVAAVIRHAKYKIRRSYHDVALIRLTTTVTFSEVISPACLGVAPSVGEPIIATGWGKTEFGGDSSFELRSVSIPIWDMGDCREIWGTSRKLPSGVSPDSQMCAGERRGGKDTCQGDSGGPAQVQDGCVWRIVAITSVGRSCGAPDTPALYARIPRAFIASQAFSDVKINNNDDNNRYNGNNNGYNGNNNGYNGNNNGYNGNNNGYNGNSNGYNGNTNQNNANNANDNRYNGNNNQNNANNNGYYENNNGYTNQNANIQNNGASLPNIGINYNVNDYNNQNNNNYDNSYNAPSVNNAYNNNNKNDIRPAVQNYDNQNNNYYNNPNTHNDYNAYTTHNYNDYNNRNGHYETPIINRYPDNNSDNNGFPFISSKPWWSI